MAQVSELHALRPIIAIDPAYADLPIDQGFNWDECFADVDEGDWYLVVFRSRHFTGIDTDLLNAYDEFAQQEARQSPDFLFYFIGTPNEHRECLSFCLWKSRSEALKASVRPAHQRAQKLTSEMYEWFQLERYIVKKTGGVPDGLIRFEPVGTR